MKTDMKIKVCGMRLGRNIEEVARHMPDYMGFIFHPGSPRFAGSILNPEVTAALPGHIRKTGVFVNASSHYIDETCKKYGLNTVQLHGGESKDQCSELKKRGYEVIKTFSLKNIDDITQTSDYTASCDFFLFDTPTSQHGGSGKKFDWSVLSGATIERPFFLSGGIEEADAQTILDDIPIQPYAIDINSRFETNPGIKNAEAVGRFIKTIRGSES
ncbi:MAG: phosphoribosylanthranilate isomerase [Marinilabiliaceae bacterium]